MNRFLFLLFLSVSAFAQDDRLIYPLAVPDSSKDTYFGTTVRDPFRWLENDELKTTKRWIGKETELSADYLGGLKKKYNPGEQLALNSANYFGTIRKSGSYYFDALLDNGIGNAASIYIKRKINDEGVQIIDPKNYQTDEQDKVTIGAFEVSGDNHYIAFCISHNGSDWNEIHVKHLYPFEDTRDIITGVKFSGIAWRKNGFFYVKYPQEGNILKDATKSPSIYYHQLGTSQNDDVSVYTSPSRNNTTLGFTLFDKDDDLVIYDNCIDAGNEQQTVLTMDLKKSANFKTDTVITTREKISFGIIGVMNNKFLVHTTLQAPKGKLVLFEKGGNKAVKELVPESKLVLHRTSIVGNKIICTYLDDIDYSAVPTGGSSSPTMSHLFSLPTDTGYHDISLVIQDVNGCLDTVTRNDYIFVGGAVVNFTATPLTGCLPFTTTFTSSTTAVGGTSIFTYFWTFYDGSTLTGTPIVSHTFTAAGTYDVSLVVTDSHGCVDSLKRYDYIEVYHPTASFTVSNPHPCIGGPVTFTSTSSSVGGIASYSWDFGDGSVSGSGSAPIHAYADTGTFDVTLTVVDIHGCTDTYVAHAFIHVTKPHAAFLMSDSISVCPPLTVNFTNTSSGATAYSWAFGDGVTSVLVSPHNLYIIPALYTVRLVVTNVYGCTDTAAHRVNIFGYAGAFTYAPLQGCAPLAVHFTATLTNVPFITWDFSDGTTSSAAYTDTITHVYVTPGAYVPKLLLSDNTGCQNSSIGIDTIKVDAVTAKFTTMPYPVCINIPFTFIDSTTFYWSPITTWAWTYDGNTSSATTPTYTFHAPGTYPVTLHVVNGWGCTDDDTHDVVVDPPPVVTASPDTTVCVGDPATLWGYGALTYTWVPPATLSCTACNPTHATPLAETQYTVTGTDRNGCIDTASVTVRMRTHTVSHAWGDTAVCYGVSVPLFDTGGTSYLWLPGDNLSSNIIFNPIATPPYTTKYTAIATLAGCLPDTNYVTVTIYPLPTVDAGPDQRVLAGSVAQLHATGKDIATYLWSPSETLSCPDCASPQASMSVTTTYRVDVLSEHGCLASDTVRILLYCDNSQVFVPNAFTPNGDGQNDVFYPRGVGIKTVKTFRIYNRWGELLFERNDFDLNDVNNAWDGNYKGSGPRPDVYVYIIKAVCYTGDEVFIKGDVTIIR